MKWVWTMWAPSLPNMLVLNLLLPQDRKLFWCVTFFSQCYVIIRKYILLILREEILSLVKIKKKMFILNTYTTMKILPKYYVNCFQNTLSKYCYVVISLYLGCNLKLILVAHRKDKQYFLFCIQNNSFQSQMS